MLFRSTGQPVDKAHYERSDISVVPAAGVIGEAMVMLTLARFVLETLGGDRMDVVRERMAAHRRLMASTPPAPLIGGRSVAPGGDEAGSGGDD